MNDALLIMDMQQGIVDRYPEAAPAVGRAAAALAAARTNGTLAAFVRIAFRPGFPEVSPNNKAFSVIANAATTFAADSDATKIHPAVSPLANEPVVLKKRVSAFAGSDLEVLLRSAGVTHLILAGIATSGVVLSTAREAADRDYRLTVLADACFDNDPEVHRVLTEKLFPRQADVLSVDDWISTLGLSS
jgi:nicotinamidase-related amidase